MTRGLDEDALTDQAVAAVADLIRHGLVLPSELID